MKVSHFASILYFIFFANLSHAFNVDLKYNSALEEDILKKYRLNKLDDKDIISAWLISDGETDSLSLVRINKLFDKLYFELNEKIDHDDDIDDKAEDIFKYLHKNVLKKPKDFSSLESLFAKGDYNILTGSAVYYLLCQRFDIPVKILTSSAYMLVNVIDGDKTIPVHIIDKRDGFNKRINQKKLVELFVEWNLIEKEELDQYGFEFVIDKYFNFYETIKPLKLMGAFYTSDGTQSIQAGEFEPALKCFEKAVFVDPENTTYLTNYKATLYNYGDMVKPVIDFLPYFKNALWFLKEDPTFTDPAIIMANKIIGYYVNDLKEFEKGLNIILEFKICYMNDKFIAHLSELEEDINYGMVMTLVSRGNYETAYKKIRSIYFKEKSLPKNKDTYVDVSRFYVSNLLDKYRDYKRAMQVVDTLMTEAGDYPIVQDLYISVILAPFYSEYNYINNNPNEAYKLAHKAYKANPDHQLTKNAISRVYHEKAMAKVRDSKLADAHRILVEGLKYYPNDRLLLEDLYQVEDAF